MKMPVEHKMMMRASVVALLVLCAVSGAGAQSTSGSLSDARELYASARYDEALALLNGLRPADTASTTDRRAVEQYRSLCLLALGRGPEAEKAIAAVVTADPMYLPSDAEASPRVRSAFSDVRQRVLPGIAVSEYAAAKRLYDGKQYDAAAERFRHVLRLLDDPDMKGQQGDLRVLASGFLELTAAASAPAAPAPKAEATAGNGAQKPAANRIYGADDKGIVAPVVVKQEMPRVPMSIAAQVRGRGVVEVVIDELGRVTFAAIRSSLHPMYDSLVLGAARDWKYQPARVAGSAVKFRKLIQFSLAKR